MWVFGVHDFIVKIIFDGENNKQYKNQINKCIKNFFFIISHFKTTGRASSTFLNGIFSIQYLFMLLLSEIFSLSRVCFPFHAFTLFVCVLSINSTSSVFVCLHFCFSFLASPLPPPLLLIIIIIAVVAITPRRC
jgi:hypothetical protein